MGTILQRDIPFAKPRDLMDGTGPSLATAHLQ